MLIPRAYRETSEISKAHAAKKAIEPGVKESITQGGKEVIKQGAKESIVQLAKTAGLHMAKTGYRFLEQSHFSGYFACSF